jgi:DNA-binding transcriptional ArsR family regulator
VAQYSAQVDGLFQALADPTRRAVLRPLSGGPASVIELARPLPMELPSFMKHIHQLEGSGWIRSRKNGRVRTCTLHRRRLTPKRAWLRNASSGRPAPTASSDSSLHRHEDHA